MYKLAAALVALIGTAVAATVYKKKTEHRKFVEALDEQTKENRPQ